MVMWVVKVDVGLEEEVALAALDQLHATSSSVRGRLVLTRKGQQLQLAAWESVKQSLESLVDD